LYTVQGFVLGENKTSNSKVFFWQQASSILAEQFLHMPLLAEFLVTVKCLHPADILTCYSLSIFCTWNTQNTSSEERLL